MEGDQDVLEAAKSEMPCPDNQAKQSTLEMKAVHLRVILEKDYKAADLKWSLFVAAAHSYRFDTCLRPFPPKFIKNGNKDMDELLSVIGDVPALDLFLKQLDDLDNLVHISPTIDLLFWVLVRLNEQSLKSVPYESHESILKNVNSVALAEKPQHIFQVLNSSKVSAESKWQDMAKNQKTFYAYHGSRLENFHSILFFGLQQHLNKNALFGNGIYLSSERCVSLSYSHDGFGWGASCLGGHLACMALCEVIDAPEGINYHRPPKTEGEGIGETGHIKERGRSSGNSIGTDTDVPHTYYVISNNDLVRVRYLLVYTKSGSTRDVLAVPTANNAGIRGWFGRHKLFSILLSYGVMLATIGFSNNQPIQFYYQALLKKIYAAINNISV